VAALSGARNGARCPTDSSRSPRSSISRKPLETVLHVVQPSSRFILITRRSQVRTCPRYTERACKAGPFCVVRPAWAAARGCKSPVDQMIETTSRSQLRRREAGWEGRRRRNRDPRNTNRIEGGAAWTRRQCTSKSVVIKRLSRRCGGCARKVAVLIRGDLPGCRPRRSSRPTPVAERRPVTRQESAEAVVAAGSCAVKGRTRSRGKARPCSRKPQQPTPPRRGLRAMDAQGEA
jgi:hypothetical protein